MTRTAAETCSTCTTALREDRRSGLIYGPYGVEDPGTGQTIHVNSHVFAAATGRCTYCGADLPRGRKRRLMAFVPDRLVVAVAQYW